MEKLYLVSPLANKTQVDLYCFKICKKILVGGIVFMDAPWFPCKEDKCQYEEKCMSFGKHKVLNETNEIIVRKLK